MSSQRHHLNGTLRCGRIIQGRTAQSTTLSTAFICCSANDTRVSNRRCPVRCFIPVTFHDFNRPDNALFILPDLSATKSDPAPSQSDTREKTPADMSVAVNRLVEKAATVLTPICRLDMSDRQKLLSVQCRSDFVVDKRPV